jgi:hypothetical protein
MSPFLQFYQQAVVALGISAALVSVVTGIVAAVFALSNRAKAVDRLGDLVPAAFFIELGLGFAVILLAFTKWMLTA